VNNEHCGALAGVIDLLVSSGTERDVQDAEKYKQLLDNMVDFQQRIGDFIKTAAAGGASPAAPPAPAAPTPVNPAAAAPPPAGKAPPEEEEVPPKKP
jgi:hypothetical protein